MRNKIFIFLLFSLAPFLGFSQTASFTAEASSTEVEVGEPFRITFTVENATNISGFRPPDFTGFEALQSSQNQSISIINGKTSRKQSYIYILRGNQVGNFIISGADARINGDETKSNPIKITVLKGSNHSNSIPSPSQQNPSRSQPGGSLPPQARNNPAILSKGEDPMEKIKKNVFVKVEVDKKEAYVGEQIVADYRLYTRLPTSSKVTKVPSFSGFSTHDLEVPDPVQPHATIIDGERYEVFTFRKTILFPLQAGEQKLDPVQIENDVNLYHLEETPGFDDPFSDLPDDPFFRDMFDDSFFRRAFGGGQHLVPQEYEYNMSSPVVTIHVKPLPEEGKPADFDNAVGQFSISSHIDHQDITTDDAVTFTVTIRGQGNIDLLSNPQINFPAALESYDPKITDNFKKAIPFGGSRTFSYILMPNTTGDVIIPPVRFSYFDPTEKAYKTIQTEPKTVHIKQGKKKTGTQNNTEDFSTNNKLFPIYQNEPKWEKAGISLFSAWWPWALLTLPVLLLAGIFYWKKKNEELSSDEILFKNKKANKVALKRLKLAKKYLKENKNKNFYEEISHAIWGYLSDKLNIPFAELSRQEAESKLQEQKIEADDLSNLSTLLDRCEMALYAGESGHENMESTYSEAVRIISKFEGEIKKTK